MTYENHYLLSQWRKLSERMSAYRLAIYGLGNNTKFILENSPNDNVICLIDAFQAGTTVCGKHVVNIEEAFAIGVTCVVIIARSANIKIIYRRISNFCLMNGITVCDINGTIISKNNVTVFDSSKYMDITFKNICIQIDHAEVVSFDILDTVIMRRFLYPTDAKDAYDELFIPRNEMVEAVRYAKSKGKDVYFISDIYLNKSKICEIFNSLNILHDLGNIILSCEYGREKHEGLFSVLREKVGNKIILHIGDNQEADFDAALKFGINEVFRVESALQMCEDSGFSALLKYDTNPLNRRVIGEFLSITLNNPFVFSETKGKLKIFKYKQAVIIAPLVCKFLNWIKAKAADYDYILLSARDGFLLNLVRNEVKEYYFNAKYFYTSRAAAVLSGIKTIEDIIEASKYPFSSSSEKMLKSRFYLDDILDRLPDEQDEIYVLRHTEQIFERAENMRKNYLKYVESFSIANSAKVGFVDLVSVGTCQRWLQKFLPFKLHGLYLGFIGNETNSDLSYDSLFNIDSALDSKYQFMQSYLYVENIFSSYIPTLKGFDTSGTPQFFTEKRDEQQLTELKDIHMAVIEYTKNNTDINFAKVDKELADYLLGLFDNRYSILESELSAISDDDFTGRYGSERVAQ